MEILFYGLMALLGFAAWLATGLLAMVCEIRWGFPFGILPPPREYDNNKGREIRKDIVMKTLFKNSITYVFAGPVAFLSDFLICLLYCVLAAWQHFFVLPARKIKNFFVVYGLSPMLVSLAIIAVILFLIWAGVL